MFKKHFETILAFALALILSVTLHLYLTNIETAETTKNELQTSMENASHRWNDFFYPEKSQETPSKNVLLVAIDEPSIIEVGRWPWSRSVINKITEQLLQYKANTISYDIIFSEKEASDSDTPFSKTISKVSDKLIMGTFSDYPAAHTKPYQDYCMTQAFLYTGGGALVKINPFFVVEDEENKYEEFKFNTLFNPVFDAINEHAEGVYLKNYYIDSVAKLSQYQRNTLAYYKMQRVYDYCNDWLTNVDEYNYNESPQLVDIYLNLFKAVDSQSLRASINEFTKKTLRNPIPQYLMWRQNIGPIQEAARYTASFLAHPDQDGIIRNYPMIFRTGNQLGTSYIPSLGLQAYLAATGSQALFKIEKQEDKKLVDRVEIKDVSGSTEKIVTTLPVDNEGKLLVNYYGRQNSIAYVSAKDLLNSSPKIEYRRAISYNGSERQVEHVTVNKGDFLKNKNIIMGATAIGINDIRSTPNDIKYPGPEIHATILSNLLNQQFIHYERTEIEYASYAFFIIILGALAIFLKTGARFGAFSFATLMAIFVGLEYYSYVKGVLYHASFLYLLLLFLSYFLAFIYNFFFQSRKSNEIKRAFSKYVSKDVVEEILKNEGAIELRGQKLHMSVFFSDIRGFTEFSEKMDPVELSELLNRYFTPMSAIITAQQGTIDKYIGDAIMAMFGAPINYKDHAFQACSAALKCLAALEKINQEFVQKGWPKIDIGIGINSGFMNAGNIGSETIQNYTVIGDSVNLASRLESLNKEFKTNIIISEFTYEIVNSRFHCRPLAKVNVKGKSEPIQVYELLGAI